MGNSLAHENFKDSELSKIGCFAGNLGKVAHSRGVGGGRGKLLGNPEHKGTWGKGGQQAPPGVFPPHAKEFMPRLPS